MGPLEFHVDVERWPLVRPFSITGRTSHCAEVVVVRLGRDGLFGRGEAAGVYYRKNERPEELSAQLHSLKPRIEAGIERSALRTLLPPGGARNALDCAMWELESNLAGKPVWALAGMEQPKSLLTTFTCGADVPEAMATVARGYEHARAIKVKLTGESMDADRVRAIREARPDVWLGVDANQGFTPESLERLMPVLVAARVSLIEQPFPIGHEELMDGLRSPIPFAADESVQDGANLAQMAGRFSVINVKLDKCGGLTEGLAMARRIRELGMDIMIGNMMGTSLAMAPAFLIGQFCKIVDLDGPALLKNDREASVQYVDGLISVPDAVWGHH